MRVGKEPVLGVCKVGVAVLVGKEGLTVSVAHFVRMAPGVRVAFKVAIGLLLGRGVMEGAVEEPGVDGAGGG